jgi:hypothetical protein
MDEKMNTLNWYDKQSEGIQKELTIHENYKAKSCLSKLQICDFGFERKLILAILTTFRLHGKWH